MPRAVQKRVAIDDIERFLLACHVQNIVSGTENKFTPAGRPGGGEELPERRRCSLREHRRGGGPHDRLEVVLARREPGTAARQRRADLDELVPDADDQLVVRDVEHRLAARRGDDGVLRVLQHLAVPPDEAGEHGRVARRDDRPPGDEHQRPSDDRPEHDRISGVPERRDDARDRVLRDVLDVAHALRVDDERAHHLARLVRDEAVDPHPQGELPVLAGVRPEVELPLALGEPALHVELPPEGDVGGDARERRLRPRQGDHRPGAVGPDDGVDAHRRPAQGRGVRVLRGAVGSLSHVSVALQIHLVLLFSSIRACSCPAFRRPSHAPLACDKTRAILSALRICVKGCPYMILDT